MVPTHFLQPFTVELWTKGLHWLEETLARLGDFSSALAAYEKPIERRPNEWVTLSQGLTTEE
jgi:hypothetical protein